MPTLMDVPAVATRLGLTPLQIRAEHARGVLPARRVSGRFLRFTEDDVTTYLARIADDKGSKGSGQTAGSRAHNRTA